VAVQVQNLSSAESTALVAGAAASGRWSFAATPCTNRDSAWRFQSGSSIVTMPRRTTSNGSATITASNSWAADDVVTTTPRLLAVTAETSVPSSTRSPRW